jgi:hypothetical protein
MPSRAFWLPVFFNHATMSAAMGLAICLFLLFGVLCSPVQVNKRTWNSEQYEQTEIPD